MRIISHYIERKMGSVAELVYCDTQDYRDM
jgi:hypothetical protein